MATRQLLTKHYTRILANWPQDLLRPETPFQSLLQARIAKIPSLTDADATAELRNVNALYSLMDDRYSRKYPIPKDLMKPESNPQHYELIAEEINEVPTRTQVEGWWIWLRGKARFT